MKLRIFLCAALVFLTFCKKGDEKKAMIPPPPSKKPNQFAVPYKISFPEENPYSKEKTQLGKMLFYETRLSSSNATSCATCHNPSFAYSLPIPSILSHTGSRIKRNIPSITNLAFSKVFFADGRATSLESIPYTWTDPITNTAKSEEEILKTLEGIPFYKQQLEKTFPESKVSMKSIALAISSYLRSIQSRDAAIDIFIESEDKAISESAKKGFEIFQGKGNCISCHKGPSFSDGEFYNIGLTEELNKEPSSSLSSKKQMKKNSQKVYDEGRFLFTKDEKDLLKFKTPTLRDIASTAPYMHNGIYKTLEEVVDHYNQGGVEKAKIDEKIKPLELTDEEKKDLVEFLRTLNGKPTKLEIVELP